MHYVDCTWCQKEVRLIEDDDLGVLNRSQFICSDCLIDLLPKQLVPDTDLSRRSNDDSERRLVERFPVYSHAYLMVHRSTLPRFFGAEILNISDVGMKLVMKDHFNVGDTITISFHGQRVIYKVTGEVTRSRQLERDDLDSFEIGVRFSAINQELR